MENISGLFIVYIVAMILIMGMSVGIWLISSIGASSVFGTAFIVHTLLMVWALWDHISEGAK